MHLFHTLTEAEIWHTCMHVMFFLPASTHTHIERPFYEALLCLSVCVWGGDMLEYWVMQIMPHHGEGRSHMVCEGIFFWWQHMG